MSSSWPRFDVICKDGKFADFYYTVQSLSSVTVMFFVWDGKQIAHQLLIFLWQLNGKLPIMLFRGSF
jgi:hypothetical protein